MRALTTQSSVITAVEMQGGGGVQAALRSPAIVDRLTRSALERVAVYRQIAKSPVGLLHPAADTWTLIRRGNQQIFDFPVKTNEFLRGGTAAQIGPDGVARAVAFNPASRFTGPTTYRIFWNGGSLSSMRSGRMAAFNSSRLKKR